MVHLTDKLISVATEDKVPFGRSIIHALPIVLAVSLITACIHSFGWLRPFETTTLDTLITLNPVSAKHVYLVEIQNADYKNIFENKSPLAPEKVAQLVEAIEVGEPKVIVVDLDTSDERFKGMKLPASAASVVWARHAKGLPNEDENTKQKSDAVNGGQHAESKQSENQSRNRASNDPSSKLLYADRVLGKEASGAIGLPLSGLSILPMDSDGVIRHYCRYVNAVEANSASARMLATLPWVAVQTFLADHKEDAHPSDEEMVLASVGGRKYLPRISASDLLEIYQELGWKEAVKGKVVLLGGDYDAARDDYLSASGRMPGVELLAEAIESELSRGGIHPVNTVWLVITQVLASFIVVAINSRFPGTRTALIGLLAIPFAAFLFSLLSFSSLYLWVDFVPVLFAVQLLYLFEHIKRVRQQNVELNKANHELRQVNAELKQANTELVRARHELATAVDQGAEQERKRLAQELHDDTLGQLFQVSVGLQPLSSSSDDGEKIGKVLGTVHQTMANIRKIMMNLYPPVLEKFGLCAAIEELCTNHSGGALEISFSDQSGKLPERFDKKTQLALYRIIQEALNNVRKHSQASRAEITLSQSNGCFTLSVIDNGKGIGNPTERTDSYGLPGMRNKAALVGAKIMWISPPTTRPSGTELRVELPTATAADIN